MCYYDCVFIVRGEKSQNSGGVELCGSASRSTYDASVSVNSVNVNKPIKKLKVVHFVRSELDLFSQDRNTAIIGFKIPNKHPGTRLRS